MCLLARMLAAGQYKPTVHKEVPSRQVYFQAHTTIFGWKILRRKNPPHPLFSPTLPDTHTIPRQGFKMSDRKPPVEADLVLFEAAEPTNPPLQCAICFEPFDRGIRPVCHNRHAWCQSCIASSVEVAVKNISDPSCMPPRCCGDAVLPTDTLWNPAEHPVLRLLDPDTRAS